MNNGILETHHDTLDDLDGLDLTPTFKKWTDAVRAQKASYHALDNTMNLDIGDPAIDIEVVGPRREPDGNFKWLKGHSHTINGHSLMFRLVHKPVRFMFSGDANIQGGKHQMEEPGSGLRFDAHVLKSPHHGSHAFYFPFLRAVRSEQHLLFSTEIAATFGVDKKNPVVLPELPDDMDDSQLSMGKLCGD